MGAGNDPRYQNEVCFDTFPFPADVPEGWQFLKLTDGLQVYTGRKSGGTSFALTPGEAYFVKMATTVNYTPSHY